jgi:hypothetical protein
VSELAAAAPCLLEAVQPLLHVLQLLVEDVVPAPRTVSTTVVYADSRHHCEHCVSSALSIRARARNRTHACTTDYRALLSLKAL